MPKAALESWNRGRRQGLKGSTTSYAIVNSLERDPLIPLHHVKTFIMNCEMHVPKMASLHVHSCTAWHDLLIFQRLHSFQAVVDALEYYAGISNIPDFRST
jgi:hypothetical protein